MGNLVSQGLGWERVVGYGFRIDVSVGPRLDGWPRNQRSFRVDRPASAKSADTIQKRAMIFDSGTPIFSK